MAENSPDPGAVYDCLQGQLAETSCVGHGDEIVRYGAFVGSVIESHSCLVRAMEYGRNLIRSSTEAGVSFASGTVILADSMSGSRGRFSRRWHAPKGGVWGCMIHANTFLPKSRQLISLGVGVACCETVRSFGGQGAELRWVNDVLVNGKKIAGFLLETYTDHLHGEEFTLVGFGININNRSFPPELQETAISLVEILGKEIDLTDFTTLFLAKLAWYFGLLYYEEVLELSGESCSGHDGGHPLLERWRQLSSTVGKRVIYGFDVVNSPLYQAEVLAIDEYGGLILRLDDGHIKKEYSGEVRYLSKT